MLVTAKRLGWDHTKDGPSKYEEYDPFDGDEEEVILGELDKFQVKSPFVPEYTQYLVAGQVVDPKTIKEIK